MSRQRLIAIALLLAPAFAAVGLQGSPARAQAPYRPDLVGIPGPELVIDVRWTGDRHGEFINIGQLPPAFRGPGPATSPSGFTPPLGGYGAPSAFPAPGLSAAPPAFPPTPLVVAPPFPSTPVPVASPMLFPPPTVLGPLPR